MNLQKRLLVRMVALLDVVIAAVLAILIFAGIISIPVIVPAVLAFCAVIMVVISFVL